MTAETLSVLITLSADTQQTATALDHGILVSLLADGGNAEVGAYDWATLGDTPVYAGMLADVNGPFAELDGRLDGYLRTSGAARQLLLTTRPGLEWFVPHPAGIRVSLAADGAGHRQGRVDGAPAAAVSIYRESTGGRVAARGDATIAADGRLVQRGASALPHVLPGRLLRPRDGDPVRRIAANTRRICRDGANVAAMRNDRLLAVLAAVLGIALIVVGVIYLVQNEHDIPSFFPGHFSQPSSHHHTKHGDRGDPARPCLLRLRLVPHRAARAAGTTDLVLVLAGQPDHVLPGDRDRPHPGDHGAVPDLEPRATRWCCPKLFGWNLNQNEPYFLAFLVATHLATAIVLLPVLPARVGEDPPRARPQPPRPPDLARRRRRPPRLALVVGTIPAGILGLTFEHAAALAVREPDGRPPSS